MTLLSDDEQRLRASALENAKLREEIARLRERNAEHEARYDALEAKEDAEGLRAEISYLKDAVIPALKSEVERLADAETSLRIYDPGRSSEYWVRWPSADEQESKR